MPVKKYGLVILNPVTSAKENYPSSQQPIVELIWDVIGGGEFSNTDLLLAIKEEKRYMQKNCNDVNDATIKGFVGGIKGTDRRLILRAKNTGIFLNLRCTMVTGTVLLTTELSYFVCARYNFTPFNLQSHCGGCDTAFKVRHTLICIKVGLVIARKNEVHEKLLYLDRRAFTSTSVWAKPLIRQGRARS